LGKQNPMDKMKADAMGSMMGSGSSMSMPDAGSLMKGSTKKSSSLQNQAMDMAKEEAIDMAAGEAEKAVGKEMLKKETAKSAIKSVI